MSYLSLCLTLPKEENDVSTYLNREPKNYPGISDISVFYGINSPRNMEKISEISSLIKNDKDIIIFMKPRVIEEKDISLYQIDSLIDQARKIKEKKENWIADLFGEMRDLTFEEQENYKKSLLEISEPTEENFWD